MVLCANYSCLGCGMLWVTQILLGLHGRSQSHSFFCWVCPFWGSIKLQLYGHILGNTWWWSSFIATPACQWHDFPSYVLGFKSFLYFTVHETADAWHLTERFRPSHAGTLHVAWFGIPTTAQPLMAVQCVWKIIHWFFRRYSMYGIFTNIYKYKMTLDCVSPDVSLPRAIRTHLCLQLHKNVCTCFNTFDVLGFYIYLQVCVKRANYWQFGLRSWAITVLASVMMLLCFHVVDLLLQVNTHDFYTFGTYHIFDGFHYWNKNGQPVNPACCLHFKDQTDNVEEHSWNV